MPSAGGQSFTRDDYAAHGQRLVARYQRLAQAVEATEDGPVVSDLFVQVETPAERPIRSERLRLGNLGLDLISVSSADPSRGTARIPRNAFNRLRSRLYRYADAPDHPGRSNLSVVEDLREVPVEEKVGASLVEIAAERPAPCLVTLYSVLPAADKDAVAQSIATELRRRGKTDVRVRVFVNGTVAVATDLSAEEMRDVGARYMSVRAISPNPQAVIAHSIAIRPLPNPITVNPPASDQAVVIIDSGINDNCPLVGRLVRDRVAFLPSGAVAPQLDHGTFVASRVLYGDRLEAELASGALTPACALIDVPVFGVDAKGNVIGPREDELAAIIGQVVPRFAKTARVFNLSLGFDQPISANSFSPLAALLDHLAHEHDVVFVVAAGNINVPAAVPPQHFLDPSARIQPPAEALLAISVGSVAKFSEASCLAAVDEVSPFSRVGPGADSGIKPEVVAHGGNLTANWGASPRTSTYGVAGDGGSLAFDNGTSFSAPLVSRGAVQLLAAYDDASLNLTRALMFHFCDPVSPPPLPAINSRDFHGFGEPNISRSLYSAANGVAFLYQGTIRDDTYQYVPFHVPDALAAGTSKYPLLLRGTLVYDPPVDPDNGSEYSKARIAAALFKRVEVGLRQVAIGATELDVSKPWNPILFFQRRFSRGYLTGEWQFRLRLMTRGKLPQGYEQSFAVVLEVIDPTGKIDVRDRVITETGGRFHVVTLGAAA